MGLGIPEFASPVGQDRYRLIFDNAASLIVVLDTEGVVRHCNGRSMALLGIAPREVVGRPMTDFLPADEHARAWESLGKIAVESVRFEEYRLLRGDGGTVHVTVNSAALFDEQGNVREVVSILDDITALRQAQAQAMLAERLASIGQMAAGLAHESGNALQRSQACLEMLALRVEHDQAAADLVRRVQAAQDDLHRLHEEVRQYAAPLVLQRRRLELDEAVCESWEQLAGQRRGRTAALQVETGGATCLADRLALQRVFRNILRNSLDAAADPVEIDVRCERVMWRGGPAVRIAIHDNGPGLTAEQETRIFEPFFTTKTHGTGLGMPISRRIIEAHGGQINVGHDRATGAEIVTLLPAG